MNTAIISLGSNINPRGNIEQAINFLRQCEWAAVEKISSLIDTKPVGYENQPDFINGAALIRTDLNKEDLRKKLKEIEQRLGREHTENKYGPRTIDLDIVVWNNVIIDPDYNTRDFLRKSIAEVTDSATLAASAGGC